MEIDNERHIRESFSLTSIPVEIQQYLKNECDQQTIAITCSGGADSVFLVRWFHAHFASTKTEAILLHFNHQTRSKESDLDQQFVEELGKKLGYEVICGTRDPGTGDSNSEESLRDARFAFIWKTMKSRGVKTLLTGHHLSDKIETLLMRLSRGSTLEGLVAPAAIQRLRNGNIHVRPLIAFRKDEMIQVLKEIDQPWREDLSNQNNKYYRNFIRNDLLQHWNQHCPQKLYENIGQSCSLLQEDATALNNWAEEAVKTINLEDSVYPISQQMNLPAAIRRRGLYMWLNRHMISENVSIVLMNQLIAAKPKQSFNLSEGCRLITDSNGDLLIEKNETQNSRWDFEFQLRSSNTLFFPEGFHLKAEILPASADRIQEICSGTDNPAQQVHLDTETGRVTNGLHVTFWQHGMSYEPLGLTNRKKLHDCFIDRKIPQNKRHRLPVVTNNEGKVLWVPGLLPSNEARVTQGTKALLRLTYERS